MVDAWAVPGLYLAAAPPYWWSSGPSGPAAAALAAFLRRHQKKTPAPMRATAPMATPTPMPAAAPDDRPLEAGSAVPVDEEVAEALRPVPVRVPEVPLALADPEAPALVVVMEDDVAEEAGAVD